MALCALAMATVGSTVVASRLIASGLPPFTATALRFAVATPVLWLLMHATRAVWPRPDRRDGALLLMQAACGSVGYTVLLILGTRYAPAADAGVVAGTLLTFIPAAGDYVNAALLGTPKNTMSGNRIEYSFLSVNDYPTAAVLSFILMISILIMVLLYIRRVGTEDLV